MQVSPNWKFIVLAYIYYIQLKGNYSVDYICNFVFNI